MDVMERYNLKDSEVFWLWWILSPQLIDAGADTRPGHDYAKGEVRGSKEFEIRDQYIDKPFVKHESRKFNHETRIKQYHVRRGHWYNSFSLVLLVILLIILIPIAAAIAFSIVISLFVNQNLFTTMAMFGW